MALVWGFQQSAAYPKILGACALALLVVAALSHGRPCQVELSSTDEHRRVVRAQPASASLTAVGRYPASRLRLVEGSTRDPVRTIAMPKPIGGPTTIRLQLATQQRGLFPIGPFTLIQGDPWGLVQRTVSSDPGGQILVLPRIVRLGNDMRRKLGLDSPTRGNRAGEGQFHALREYVLGDEPRLVHWRSSARAGKLIVRQDVAPTSVGSLILLDVDESAYSVETRLAGEFDALRFETAVEVAGSIAVAQGRDLEVAHLATTANMISLATATSGMAEGLLDALAVVDTATPVNNSPELLAGLVTNLKVSRLVVVTGTPSARILAAVDRVAGRLAVVVVRVATAAPGRIPRVSVVDVQTADDLS